jgi:hypothetical protein
VFQTQGDASLQAGKKMEFQLLRLWKEFLEQIKGEVDRVIVRVSEGLKVFGLGPKDRSFFGSWKPAFGPKHKKGFPLRVGPGQVLVRKPNTKRGAFLGADKGLGSLAGSDAGCGGPSSLARFDGPSKPTSEEMIDGQLLRI